MIWRIYYRSAGYHVKLRVFVGPQEGALGLAGELTLRPHEFTELTRVQRVMAIDWRADVKADGRTPDIDPASPPVFAKVREY